MRLWVYGTTFNNVDTVEESIASVFAPDVGISIVDAYSTDGTYEKLLELKKEYNLVLARAKCSRGRGRDIALRMCPSGSFAAYIDFDAVYNQNFRKILECEANRTLVWQHHSQTCYFSKVETALGRGGFRDLNSFETLEFILRCGVERTLPVQVGRNMKYAFEGFGGRETRYASGLGLYLRLLNVWVDSVRAQGLSYREFTEYYGYLRSPVFLAAWFRGIYRFDPNISNIELFFVRMVETLCDHRDFGISDEWAALVLPHPLLSGRPVDRVVLERWGSFRKYRRVSPGPKWSFPVLKDRDFIVYAKTELGLKNYVEADPTGKMCLRDFQEVGAAPGLSA